MKPHKKAIDNLYSTKEELLIIGLTGRTGAGCSTVAKILKKTFEEMDFEYVDRPEWSKGDQYKFDIIKEYISKDKHWEPFDVVEGSCVILSYVFEGTDVNKDPLHELKEYLDKIQMEEAETKFEIDNYNGLLKDLDGLKYIFEEMKQYPLNNKKVEDLTEDRIPDYYEMYVNKISEHKDRIKRILQNYTCHEIVKSKLKEQQRITYHLYTYLLQKIGNNIRCSGNPYNDEFNQEGFYAFAKKLEKIIEIIKLHNKEKKCTRICIDAIRNVNESNYLKNKYRGYYLISIGVDEKDRKMRLRNLSANEQDGIDNVEYAKKYKPEEFFYHQNIAQCFEMADIHLYNEEVTTPKKFFLTWQLIKYITLMIHPGLVTPTQLERCMQLAFNAKYNSGCLSRQVGAVVTDGEFSVKAVGWNDVPKGQVPCNLRDVKLFCKGNYEDCFSQYEKEDSQFQKAMKDINETIMKTDEIKDRRFPYCFKDIYNGYKKEKNQVFTRALHAEENAFLQISKYGGQGIQNGFLFCTASPCELCSKKAYQLGVTNIYYIDPYPGISEKHILRFGKENKGPKMNLFYGAIGEAYMSLYRPLLPYKDELELISGISCKEIASSGKKYGKEEPKTNDLLYHSINVKIKFISREIIESVRSVDFTIQNGVFDGIDRYLTWTGSSYDGTEIIDGDYYIEDYRDEHSPYRYRINFGEDRNNENTKDKHIRYTVCSKVKDEGHLMQAYFSNYIKYPTKNLELEIIVPKNSEILKDIEYIRYADKEMQVKYPEKIPPEIQVSELQEEEKIWQVYKVNITDPNLFYTYSLEWEFIK